MIGFVQQLLAGTHTALDSQVWYKGYRSAILKATTTAYLTKIAREFRAM